MDVSALNDNLSTEDCIEITNGHVKPSQQSIAARNQNVSRHVLWMPESKKAEYNVDLCSQIKSRSWSEIRGSRFNSMYIFRRLNGHIERFY